jgi:hypothetical protein
MMTRLFCLCAVASLSVGCSWPQRADPMLEVPPPAEQAKTAPSPSASAKPWVPLGRYVPGEMFRDLGDGRRYAIASSRRVIVQDGKARLIDEHTVEDLGRPSRIPERLGGGFLFIGDRTVRFAKEFDGALIPVTSTTSKPDDLRVGVGHGRVLVDTGEPPPKLYALPSGKPLPLEPPGLLQLFGTPQGMVAAVDAKHELYLSEATGAPFKKLPAGRVSLLRYDGKGIVVDRDGDGALRLGFDGKLGPLPNEPGLTVASNVDAFQDPFPDMSRPPPESPDIEKLLNPLARAMTPKIAIAVRGDDLVFLDATTGKVAQAVSRAFGGKANCFPIQGGVPSFIGCNAGEMTLFRIDAVGAAPVVERAIKGIYTQDFGSPPPEAPLAFSGKCNGAKQKGSLCLRESAARWRDLPPPPDPGGLLDRVPFMVHVAAAKDGSVFAFGWLDGGGDLIILDGKAQKVRRVPKSSVPPWAENGVDWHSLTIESGTLRFLLSSGSHSKAAGIVQIRPDDTIEAEQLDGYLSAARGHALQVTKSGKLRETLDAGRTFQEIELPPTGAPRPDHEFFGCTETGCMVGPWIRAGWGFLSP